MQKSEKKFEKRLIFHPKTPIIKVDDVKTGRRKPKKMKKN